MNTSERSILIIDDDIDVLHTVRVVLKPHYKNIATEVNPEKIRYLITHRQFDIILLDMNYTIGVTSGKEGLSWLRQIIDLVPTQKVIMMTAYGELKLAVEAMKYGAADFIVKPWENERLLATINSVFKQHESEQELLTLKTNQRALNEIKPAENELIGDSTVMQNIRNTIYKVANTDANILILGENGTGKEVVARMLHAQSSRNGQPFIKVDMGALTESLFESELFGHKKGAFTDAIEDREGRIQLADKGSLFLDEIGNISLSQQAKLLSVLQSREVIKVGDNRPTQFDCRIISATNENIALRVAEKDFRQDLLYRLNTVEITLPPLRERVKDIVLLVNHFLKNYNQRYKKELIFSDSAIRELSSYHWPGNVRELQHAVERIVIMSDGPIIQPADILLKRQISEGVTDSLNLDDVERQTIERAIRKAEGNMSQAAKILGLGRTTLYRKLDKYGIDY